MWKNVLRKSHHYSRQVARTVRPNYNSATMEATTDECTITPDRVQECRCNAPDEVRPCSVCPGGEDVGLPDKDLTWPELSGAVFQDTIAATMHMDSQACKTTRSIAKLCGCPPTRKNACNSCSDGGQVQNPYAARGDLRVWGRGLGYI